MNVPQLSAGLDERKALVRGLINALIRNESIETTEAKANAIKRVVEKLVTKARRADLHNRRQVESFLEEETNAKKLVEQLAPALKKHSGGYVRITKLGRRKGDNAMIVRVEFSERADVKPTASKAKIVTRAKSVSLKTKKSGKTAKKTETSGEK